MRGWTRLVMVALLLMLAAGPVFAAGQSEAHTGDVTISFWHFPQVMNVPGFETQSVEHGDFWAYLAREFSAMDNGIKVETELIPWTGGFERFNVAIAGGTPPTIGYDYLGRTGQYYAMGAAVAVDDVLPAWMIEDTLDSIRDIYRVEGGKMHALPGFAWNAGMMVINVGLLEKHGWTGPILNGPGEPYTFDQWVDFLKEVRATVPNNIVPTAWSCGDEQGDYSWWSIFWGYGARMFGPDGNITKDPSGIIKGYELIRHLQENRLAPAGIASMRGNEVNDLFNRGLSVMNGGSLIAFTNGIQRGIAEGILDFELNLMPVPFPTESGTIGYSSVGPSGFIIFSKNSREQAAAATWIEFVTSEEYWPAMTAAAGQFVMQKRYADIDLYAGNQTMQYVKEMLANFAAGDFGLAHPKYQQIRIAQSQAGQKIFTGMAPIPVAVEEYLQEARRLNNE